MIGSFRRIGKSWVSKLFFGLIISSFVVWGIADVFTGFAAQDLVTVGKIKVGSEDYRRDLNTELSRLSQQTGTPFTLEQARDMGLDREIFNRLVNAAVLDNKAIDMGLAIADSQIANDMAAMPRFQGPGGKFDPALFRAALLKEGLTETGFLSAEKINRLRLALTNIASSDVKLPRTLVEALLRYRNETRDGRYFTFTVSEADVPTPSAEDLKKQYEATPSAYTAPEYRSIAVIKVEPADVAARINVSDADIAQSYETRKLDFFTPEKRTILQLSFPDIIKAEAAKKRLDGGEDFLKIAEELKAKESDITFTGLTKSDFIDGKIGEAAFALAEGAVSQPVKGDLANAILKVVKITPSNQKPLADVRDVLIKDLQLNRARDEIQSIYDAIEDARGNQTAFEDIAGKAGLPFTLVPAVSAAGLDRDGKPVTVPGQPDVFKAAFDSDVGVEADALSTGDGYVWYEVREVIPSTLRPLDEINDSVKADYIAGKLRTIAADKAKALIEKAGATSKIDSLAGELSAEVKSVTGLKRIDTSEAFDGLATTALFSAAQGKLTWSLDGDGKTARIIEVTKVNVPTFNAASADVKDVSDLAKSGLGSDLADAYMKAVRRNSNLAINDALWQTIRGTSR